MSWLSSSCVNHHGINMRYVLKGLLFLEALILFGPTFLVSGGLTVGFLLSIFMIYALLNGLMANDNNPLNAMATVGVAPLIGPFLLLTHLLALMYFRNKSSTSQPKADADQIARTPT